MQNTITLNTQQAVQLDNYSGSCPSTAGNLDGTSGGGWDTITYTGGPYKAAQPIGDDGAYPSGDWDSNKGFHVNVVGAQQWNLDKPEEPGSPFIDADEFMDWHDEV